MKRELWATLGIAGMAVASVLTVALPASAVAPAPVYAAGDWQLRDIGLTDSEWQPDSELSEVDCESNTLTLTKPAGDVSTSFENTNLGVAVSDGDQLVVDYLLDDPADTGAGAIRMFVYGAVDADTLTVAPTMPVVEANPSWDIAPDGEATDGQLTIDFNGAGTIGTFGLVYDASNNTDDTVTFTGLRLVHSQESQPISLCDKPVETTTTTATSTCVDLNTASLEQLDTLEHVGPAIAQDIVDMRPISNIDELEEIDGISSGYVQDIKDQGLVCQATSAARLPVTGAATTGVIIAGAGLIAAGAAILIILRRRQREESA